jgi:hypothetical protein
MEVYSGCETQWHHLVPYTPLNIEQKKQPIVAVLCVKLVNVGPGIETAGNIVIV